MNAISDKITTPMLARQRRIKISDLFMRTFGDDKVFANTISSISSDFRDILRLDHISDDARSAIDKLDFGSAAQKKQWRRAHRLKKKKLLQASFYNSLIG